MFIDNESANVYFGKEAQSRQEMRASREFQFKKSQEENKGDQNREAAGQNEDSKEGLSREDYRQKWNRFEKAEKKFSGKVKVDRRRQNWFL